MSLAGKGISLAFVGDDFTGSAASMEALEFAGVPSVLFLDTPGPELLARFPAARAVGVATTARSHGPDWMARRLPPIFAFLKSTGAPVIHYKVCSTLDSAPEIGCIGKALEIGAEATGARTIPFLVAAPVMRRYQAFGQLFAAAGDAIHRLDRHPVMAHHPVTPMREADVARHLALQTGLPVSTLTVEDLAGDPVSALAARQGIVTLDAMSESDMAVNGALISSLPAPVLAGGSQGVEYALIEHWRASGALPHVSRTEGAGSVERIIAVSGSASATTAEQIAWAERSGFDVISLDAGALATQGDVQPAFDAAMAALNAGRDALICTARGPADPSIARMRETIVAAGVDAETANARIGAALGRLLKRLLTQSGIRRAVISGGDTSGHACSELGVHALTALAPTIPGAALLAAHGDDPALAGLQLALKGGQMGTTDYFGWIKRGGGTA